MFSIYINRVVKGLGRGVKGRGTAMRITGVRERRKLKLNVGKTKVVRRSHFGRTGTT